MPEKENKKRRSLIWFLRSIGIFISKAVFFLFSVVFLTLLSFLILFQFSWFRGPVIDLGLGITDSALEAKIELEDLRFDLFNGIELHEVKLITAGDTLANVEKISIDLNFLALFDGKISVNDMLLKKPVIRLLRNNYDSTWNFEHIVKPSDDTTETDSKTKLIIDVSILKMIDGDVSFMDSTSGKPKDEVLDYVFFRLKNFRLGMSATVDLGESTINTRIYDLSGIEYPSGLVIENFKMNAFLDTNAINVKYLKLNLPGSELEMETRLGNFGVLVGKTDIAKAELITNIRAENFTSEQFEKIVDLPGLLNGVFDFEMKALGSFKELDIEELVLKSGNTNLKMSGVISEFTDADKLHYDIKVYDSYTGPRELDGLFPFVDLSLLFDINYFKIETLNAKGTVWDVSGDCKLESDLGNVNAVFALDYGKDLMEYDVDVKATKFDPAKLIRDAAYQGNVQFDLKASGRGFDFYGMESEILFSSIDSRIANIGYSEGFINCSIGDGGVLSLDTLYFNFIRDSSEVPYYMWSFPSEIRSSGTFSLKNKLIPEYNMIFDFAGIDISRIIDEPYIPQFSTGMIEIKGSGAALDSLEGGISMDIIDCMFGDRALMPFKVEMNIERFGDSSRSVNILSEYLNAKLSGNFNFDELIPSISTNIAHLGSYVQNNLETISPEMGKTKSDSSFAYIGNFPDVNFKFEAEINDLSPLSIISDSLDIFLRSDIKMSYFSGGEVSRLQIDSFNISNISARIGGIQINSSPIDISGGYILKIIDSLPTLQTIDISVNSEKSVFINDLEIEKPQIALNFVEGYAGFDISAMINNIISFDTGGKFIFKTSQLELIADSLWVEYNNKFRWTALEQIDIRSGNDQIIIDNFVLSRENAETIKVRGAYDGNVFKDLNISIYDFPINEINKLMDEKNESLSDFFGNIDSLSITVNDSLESPKIDIKSIGSAFSLNNIYIGEFELSLFSANKNISGNINFIDNYKDMKTLGLKVNSLPLDLSLNGMEEFVSKTEPFDLRLNTIKFPLGFISPFVPSVSQVRGVTDINLSVGGIYPDLSYTGNLNFKNASFLLEPTNIRYYGDAVLEFNKDRVDITELYLRNFENDMKGGIASVSGYVLLEDFMPSDLHLKLKSEGMLVMSDATSKSMPDMYGQMIISTGGEHLNISGDLDYPVITGDINLLSANLNMPYTEGIQETRSVFKYVVYDSTLYVTDSVIVLSDSTEIDKVPEKKVSELSILDRTKMDIRIKVLNDFIVRMGFGPIFELVSVIRTPDRSVPLRYIKRSPKDEQFTGQLIVDERSVLKLHKSFKTKGEIAFPTGDIQNPYLDVVSEYEGKSYANDETNDYKVRVILNGYRDKLKIKFSYDWRGEEVQGDSSQIAQEALFLILTGQRSPFNNSGGSNPAQGTVVTDMANSTVSAGGSYLLNQLLSGNAFIQSADIDFGDNFEDTRVKITGKLFSDISIEAGGSIADLATNNEISINVPISSLFGIPDLNINSQFTTSTNQNTTVSPDQKSWEIKLKFGKSW